MTNPTYLRPIFDTFPTLETPRLRLRELKPADAAAVFNIFSDDEVTRYYDLETFSNIQEAEALINRQRDRFEQNAGFRWGITLKGEDIVLGTIGLMLTVENNQGGLGYDLARPYWRRGIMYEALQSTIQYAFQTVRLGRIQALVMPGNTASASLLEKLGFQDQGLLKNYAFFKDRLQDLQNFILEK